MGNAETSKDENAAAPAEDQNTDSTAGADSGNAETSKEETAASPAPDEPKAKTAIEQEAEAKEKEDEVNRKVASIRAKIDAIPDEYLGYAGLDGVEISKKIG